MCFWSPVTFDALVIKKKKHQVCVYIASVKTYAYVL